MIKERLIGYIEQSISKNWDIEALSNYKEKGYTYKEIAENILKLHIFFRESGIKEGDKIALVGRNSANWCMIYLATVTYGAVIVPILPDFKPDDLVNLINHSDSKILFVDDKIHESLNESKLPGVKAFISVDTRRMINSTDALMSESFATMTEKFQMKWEKLLE